MCEACDAKQQQLQGERTVTFCDAGDLSDNSCTLEEVTFLKLKETTVHYSLCTVRWRGTIESIMVLTVTAVCRSISITTHEQELCFCGSEHLSGSIKNHFWLFITV